MVLLFAIWAESWYLLPGLVFGQTGLGHVRPGAHAAYGRAVAARAVVAVLLTSEAAQWFPVEGACIKHPPTPQVETAREGAFHRDDDLAGVQPISRLAPVR